MKMKLFTCVWSEYGREVMGVEDDTNPIFSVDPDVHGVKVNLSGRKSKKARMVDAEMYPFFETREEAEAYRDGNEYWTTVEAEVTLQTVPKEPLPVKE